MSKHIDIDLLRDDVRLVVKTLTDKNDEDTECTVEILKTALEFLDSREVGAFATVMTAITVCASILYHATDHDESFLPMLFSGIVALSEKQAGLKGEDCYVN